MKKSSGKESSNNIISKTNNNILLDMPTAHTMLTIQNNGKKTQTLAEAATCLGKSLWLESFSNKTFANC